LPSPGIQIPPCRSSVRQAADRSSPARCALITSTSTPKTGWPARPGGAEPSCARRGGDVHAAALLQPVPDRLGFKLRVSSDAVLAHPRHVRLGRIWPTRPAACQVVPHVSHPVRAAARPRGRAWSGGRRRAADNAPADDDDAGWVGSDIRFLDLRGYEAMKRGRASVVCLRHCGRSRASALWGISGAGAAGGPAGAHAVTVGALRRLHCDARPAVALANPLRSLRSLRSNNCAESVYEARCAAPTAGLRFSSPPENRPHRAHPPRCIAGLSCANTGERLRPRASGG